MLTKHPEKKSNRKKFFIITKSLKHKKKNIILK
jgi:hypothetical protein